MHDRTEPKKHGIRSCLMTALQTLRSALQRCQKSRCKTDDSTKKRRKFPMFACAFLGVVVLFGIALWCLNAAVIAKTADRIVTPHELTEMEERFDCILVLGCGVYPDGRMSDRLRDRVDVGISLYAKGFSSVLLMSGDRSADGSYDEVGAMKTAATNAGVPEDCVWIDPRGFSTYESIVRLTELYGGQKVLIVSQEYHLYRALYIAEKLGMEAYGVSADERSYRDWFKCEVRELFARVKDIWYMQRKPAVDLSAE